jgi:hypothetical protein
VVPLEMESADRAASNRDETEGEDFAGEDGATAVHKAR